MFQRRKKQLKKLKPRKQKDKITIGDVVYMRNRFPKTKFDEKWIGPYIVIHVGENNSYVITDSTKSKDIVINGKDIKRILKSTVEEKLKCEHENFHEDVKKRKGEIVTDVNVKRLRCNNCKIFLNMELF